MSTAASTGFFSWSNTFNFESTDGGKVDGKEWLRLWSAPHIDDDDSREHAALIAKHGSFTSADFERIAKWKDGVRRGQSGKWKPNVAMVAYKIWTQAMSELPACPTDGAVAQFLTGWSERKYMDVYPSRSVEKVFGLSRASTLLHFLSAGRFAIFDSRVRKGIRRLTGLRVENTVSWYLEYFYPIFSEIAIACDTDNLRRLDDALFEYGKASKKETHRCS